MSSIDQYHGLLLLDKPSGMTSHDVINRLRRITGQKKIGHTGTLDPLATGLLVICFGRATKLTAIITDHDKGYDAEITLGRSSVTLDAEGVDATVAASSIPDLSDAQVVDLMAEFVGPIRQKVPMHSAVKIGGKHFYQLARRGIEAVTPERDVVVNSLTLTRYQSPVLSCHLECGKGTYVRVLADDIGRKLGCGAYLSGLRRTRVGQYQLTSALTFAQVEQAVAEGTFSQCLIPLKDALGWGSVLVAVSERANILNGRFPSWKQIKGISGTFVAGERIIVADERGEVLALAIASVNSRGDYGHGESPISSWVRVLS